MPVICSDAHDYKREDAIAAAKRARPALSEPIHEEPIPAEEPDSKREPGEWGNGPKRQRRRAGEPDVAVTCPLPG